MIESTEAANDRREEETIREGGVGVPFRMGGSYFEEDAEGVAECVAEVETADLNWGLAHRGCTREPLRRLP